MAVLELVEAAAGGRKHQDRQARMAKDQHFHVAAEARGIPLVILAIHTFNCSGMVVREKCNRGSFVALLFRMTVKFSSGDPVGQTQCS